MIDQKTTDKKTPNSIKMDMRKLKAAQHVNNIKEVVAEKLQTFLHDEVMLVIGEENDTNAQNGLYNTLVHSVLSHLGITIVCTLAGLLKNIELKSNDPLVKKGYKSITSDIKREWKKHTGEDL